MKQRKTSDVSREEGRGGRSGEILDLEGLARICKALGHPARLRILEHLEKSESCLCGEIVEVLPLAQSTVSQHLKILREAGVIQGEVDGPRTCYCLDRSMLDSFRRTVAGWPPPDETEGNS